MFHKILFIFSIFLIVLFGILFNHFSQTNTLLNKYQKLGLIQSDLRYEKIEKSWGEQGLIFYQVQFPFINVPIHSDKMTISLADNGMNLKLKNAKINVIEGLKKVYGPDVEEQLNNYIPYKDFLDKILTSMAVMGIDEFLGDITINTVYSDIKTMTFTINIQQENQPVLQAEGIIHIPVIGAHQMSDLWNGKIEEIRIEMSDSFSKKYTNYAKSRHYQIPQEIKNKIWRLKRKLHTLPYLKNIFR